jgi:membrane-associated phospholipid phosphatase
MDAPFPRRTWLALLLAAVFALGAAVVYAIAFHTALGRWVDEATFWGFQELEHTRTGAVAERFALLFNPLPFAGMTAAVTLIAVVRRRWRAAIAVPLAMFAANATTQILKWMVEPPPTAAWTDWPSGHATAVTSLALGLVLVASPRGRSLAVAAGGLAIAALVYGIVAAGWHLPSDVAGGFCVAATWMALAVAAIGAPAFTPSRAKPRVAIGAAVLAATAAAVYGLVNFDRVMSVAREHTAFVVGGLALGTGGMALAVVFAMLLHGRRDLSRSRRPPTPAASPTASTR